ncbi:hypothetical protein IPG36_02305 [bacterium]|nr:MAG: hypothetical protein IPG36_02305 [bacterium]
MRGIAILILIVLIGALVYLVNQALKEVRNSRLKKTVWRRSEFVDNEGNTHVILRRSVWIKGKEVFADPDREIAVIHEDDSAYRQKLAEARIEADIQVDQTNYRLPH